MQALAFPALLQSYPWHAAQLIVMIARSFGHTPCRHGLSRRYHRAIHGIAAQLFVIIARDGIVMVTSHKRPTADPCMYGDL